MHLELACSNGSWLTLALGLGLIPESISVTTSLGEHRDVSGDGDMADMDEDLPPGLDGPASASESSEEEQFSESSYIGTDEDERNDFI
ncbi:hypothetical protein M422DRAFT_245753 [Sphaerobolus stellatus SS14]|nr:hypothetical protein M422DRAFT_245753 [Sphaerobolus stellatus SS14]